MERNNKMGRWETGTTGEWQEMGGATENPTVEMHLMHAEMQTL